MIRPTTPIRTQPAGDLRCIAYSVAAAIETSICTNTGTSIGVPEISVDDVFAMGGSQVGSMFTLMQAAPKGFVDAVCRPPGSPRCAKPTPHLWTSRIEAVTYGGKGKVAVMKEVLKKAGPVVVLIEVFENFVGFTGTGLYEPAGQGGIFHAMCLLGFEEPGVGPGCWVAKNSMGPAWGDHGLCRIKWLDDVLKSENVAFVVKDVKR